MLKKQEKDTAVKRDDGGAEAAMAENMDKKSITRMVERKIEQAIIDFGMTNKLDGVLIGYSGGADSGALLSYMHKYSRAHGIHIAAAHINHCIRGAEADRDEQFCRDVCESLGIELFVERVDVPALAASDGKGLEETGRRVRYRTYRGIIDSHPELHSVALAHHAEDNMETVIFNMCRGTGIRGLSGIPPVRGERVIRPLIYCTKSEIIGYCIANDIPYVTDTTNGDIDYTRNYIRAEILPRLTRINPSPEIAISQLCTLLRNDDVYIQRQASEFLSKNEIETSCSRQLLSGQDQALLSRIVRYMYDKTAERLYGRERPYTVLDFEHVRAVTRIIKGGGAHSRISLPGKILAAVEGDDFMFLGEEEYDSKYMYCPEFNIRMDDGEHIISELDAVISVLREPDIDYEFALRGRFASFSRIALRADSIKGTLYIRSREAGDKIFSGGMNRLTKKLYCERRIPRDVRNILPVFCDDDGIVWIPELDVRDGVTAEDGGDSVDGAVFIYYARGMFAGRG